MRGVLLVWNQPRFHTLSLPSLSLSLHRTTPFTLSVSASADTQQLSARERRKQRSERRESTNWREQVEERLIKKPKKEKVSWMDELNLDNLAKLGPQWWVVRVSRANGHDTAQLLARSLANHYPDIEFKVFAPAVNVKRKLKDGSHSIKPKPLFPGCIFLRCVLNKELHDFIREYDGVGGFLGSKVGNTKRQINKPRPVSDEDMEAIFRQAKEEQEKTDQAFEEEEKNAVLNSGIPITDASSTRKNYKLVQGSTVQVVSGTFSGFTGTLKKLNRKTKMATVHFTLFGKENIVDIDASEIAPEIN
ncbi:uncharacterized protein LOC113850206 isoform X2 [Abrus precatorius]|uniref:Uncharacterized protein LOC113850206 isoform X2 n=1 Tax=Abrus precatorius TaxID=3816 RepID=A0A8B8JYA6_ABRPR|nr:uncharacterized protein LOC113850206 isoform X2 [Abrus precatorius]